MKLPSKTRLSKTNVRCAVFLVAQFRLGVTIRISLNPKIGSSGTFLYVSRAALLSLKKADNDVSELVSCHKQMALRISKDIYGSDVLSSKKLAKGYKRPVTSYSFPVEISDDIVAE